MPPRMGRRPRIPWVHADGSDCRGGFCGLGEGISGQRALFRKAGCCLLGIERKKTDLLGRPFQLPITRGQHGTVSGTSQALRYEEGRSQVNCIRAAQSVIPSKANGCRDDMVYGDDLNELPPVPLQVNQALVPAFSRYLPRTVFAAQGSRHFDKSEIRAGKGVPG